MLYVCSRIGYVMAYIADVMVDRPRGTDAGAKVASFFKLESFSARIVSSGRGPGPFSHSPPTGTGLCGEWASPKGMNLIITPGHTRG